MVKHYSPASVAVQWKLHHVFAENEIPTSEKLFHVRNGDEDFLKVSELR